MNVYESRANMGANVFSSLHWHKCISVPCVYVTALKVDVSFGTDHILTQRGIVNVLIYLYRFPRTKETLPSKFHQSQLNAYNYREKLH